jgi:glycosyltransferase involved in cell wall biosynthesis
MNAPLVSVVIPTYNYSQYIVDAVEAALAQTYSNLEVIVVDDGSTDDTQEKLRPYFGRIKYVFQRNQGAAAARNTGIQHASGEWIAFLDADDLWHPQKTEVQLRSIEGMNDVDFVAATVCDEFLDKLPEGASVQRLNVVDFLVNTLVGSPSVLVRRRCINEVGCFDASLRDAEDRDMWLRIAARFKVVKVDSPCWIYRPHPDSTSRHARRMYRAYRTVLTKFFRDHPLYRPLQARAWSFLYLDSATAYIEEGRRLRAIGFLLQSLWYNFSSFEPPRAARRRKLLVRAVLGERLFHRFKPSATGAKSNNTASSFASAAMQ